MAKPAARFEHRKLVWARKDEILSCLDQGMTIREVRSSLGFDGVPEQTFYNNVRSLKKREAKSARLYETIIAKNALQAIRPNPPKDDLQNALENEKGVPNTSLGQATSESAIQPRDAEKRGMGDGIDQGTPEQKPRRKKNFRRAVVGGYPSERKSELPKTRKDPD